MKPSIDKRLVNFDASVDTDSRKFDTSVDAAIRKFDASFSPEVQAEIKQIQASLKPKT